MRNSSIRILFLGFLLFACGSIYSQIDSLKRNETAVIDTLSSDRGNLLLLTQRIHIAFTAYRNGKSTLYNGREYPRIYIVSKENNEMRPANRNELIGKTIDMVESIEVLYNPKELPALHGASSMVGIIKIAFKKEEKEVISEDEN